MADLIAQGASPANRWRRQVPEGKSFVLGRDAGMFSADWDGLISRQHAELDWDDGRLNVRRLESARNPVFSKGSESDSFSIQAGEHFVIGQTTFTLAEECAGVSLRDSAPLQQQLFSPEYLQQLKFRNARARIEVLARLPEVISGADSQQELFVRVTSLLMAGIPTSDAVALVRATQNASEAPINVLHWDRRFLSGAAFEPSERLIREALEKRQSVLHLWAGADESKFTAVDDVDWAFCTPVLGEACQGWAIYVAGSNAARPGESSTSTDSADLSDDLKFTEVAAATLRSLQESRVLQRRQATLSQFLSPIVLDALAGRDPDVALAPRETEVTVLFCDLRGFSRESEKYADDLLGLLDRVSRALGVTTHRILETGGVVGDFQGDAAMGFWGWPFPQEDAIERASRAALAIRAELELAATQRGDPLAGFRLGIGIATGKAVAGKIGTVDQGKVTVFGPVVNLASRLEGMTKTLRVPILLDQPTAEHVRSHLSGQTARVRRLAVVRPYGLDTPVEVSELLPPESEYALLNATHLAAYESAFVAFQQGDWSSAFEHLHHVPADDRAKDFLTVLIAQHNRSAPNDWHGVIELESK